MMKAFNRIAAATVVAGVVVAGGALKAEAAAPAPCSAGYVALTYDDGPSAVTSKVSTALKANGLRATFFFLGENVQARPAVVRQVAADGNEVANHGFDHANLAELSDADAWQQMSDTSDAIRDVTGRAPRLFRPPYGATHWSIYKSAYSLGLTEVLWTLDTNDWQNKTAAQINTEVARAVAGDVILMHDANQTTVTAVPLIAKTLRDKGLCAGKIPDRVQAF
jgi:peptidoglycan/xylan/chitin deacetylase (PgdA/CDA1 family)